VIHLLPYLLIAVAWGQTPQPFTASDMHGGSELCREARAQQSPGPRCLPSAKQYMEFRRQGTQWVQMASVRDIKQKLFMDLAASFQADADFARHMGSGQLWASKEVERSVARARTKCTAAAPDGSLSTAFEGLIATAKSDGKMGQELKSLSASQKDAVLSRFALARLEISRLTRLIEDVSRPPSDRQNARKKKLELELKYPLAQEISSLSLPTLLLVHDNLKGHPATVISIEEEATIDVALGLRPRTELPDLAKYKTNRSLALGGALAERVLGGRALATRTRDEMIRSWEAAYARKIEALGNLCDASHCQAYEVSHRATAALINSTPEAEQFGLLSNICECNLSNPTELLPLSARLGIGVAVVGGLALCLGTAIACPALATVSLIATAATGAESIASLSDSHRASQVSAISGPLRGIAEEEKQRTSRFAGETAVGGLGKAALAAVGVLATPVKVALSPIQATKEIRNAKVIAEKAAAWEREFLAVVPNRHGISAEEMKRISAEIVTRGEANVGEVFKSGGVTVKSYLNKDGELVLKYTENASFSSLKGQVTERVLAVDAKTGAIDANFTGGSKLIDAVFNSSEDGAVIIFKDLNHLGQTNYYFHGQAAGDKYLQAFGAAIKKELRPEDLMFKTGGDELLSVLPLKQNPALESPEVVKNLVQRMVDAVHDSPAAQEVFRAQSGALIREFNHVGKAKDISEIPKDIVGNLSVEQLQLASANFPKFRTEFLTAQINLLKDHLKYQPSISIGAVIVRPGGNYVEAKRLAEQQARSVKVEYKAAMGATREELAKYKVQVDTLKRASEAGARRRTDIKPEPLDPVILGPPPLPGP